MLYRYLDTKYVSRIFAGPNGPVRGVVVVVKVIAAYYRASFSTSETICVHITHDCHTSPTHILEAFASHPTPHVVSHRRSLDAG